MRATAAELAVRARELAIEQVARSAGLTYAEEVALRDDAEVVSTGAGVLQAYLDDEDIEELWVNQPNELFVARSGVAERIFLKLSEVEIRSIVERLLRHSGRRLDRSSPFVDASLSDGSRLHVVIPDITKSFWSINIRKFPKRVWRLADLVERSVLTMDQAQLLAQRVHSGKNILVSGATQSGKTTMLCALLAEARASTRLITVEETYEIRTVHSDWVAMQTRQSNLEGKGEVNLRRLVKESLRMRPELLVVGEVREAESLDLLIAMNSGIPGMCTIHANTANEALEKLCTLPLLAGANISPVFVERTVRSCIDVVVHCEMHSDGSRRVAEILETSIDGLASDH